jgi:hypothetical protein
MVAGRIVEGSPKEIAEQLGRLTGMDQSVRVLVLTQNMDDPGSRTPTAVEVDQLLAEMREDAVSAGELDLTREGIYDERYR